MHSFNLVYQRTWGANVKGESEEDKEENNISCWGELSRAKPLTRQGQRVSKSDSEIQRESVLPFSVHPSPAILYPWVRSEPLFLEGHFLIDFQSALPHWP